MNPAMITIDGLTDEPHMLSALHTLAADARVTCSTVVASVSPIHCRPSVIRSRTGSPIGPRFSTRLGPSVPRSLPTSTRDSSPSVRGEVSGPYQLVILIHCFARFVRGDDYPFGINLATADALVDDSVNAGPTGTSIDTLAFVAPSVATDPAFSWLVGPDRAAGSQPRPPEQFSAGLAPEPTCVTVSQQSPRQRSCCTDALVWVSTWSCPLPAPTPPTRPTRSSHRHGLPLVHRCLRPARSCP